MLSIDLKAAFQHGVDSANAGKSIYFNPFRHGQDNVAHYIEWESGWKSIMDELEDVA
jgi:hypothetical protein